MRWSSVQMKQRENFISGWGNPGLGSRNRTSLRQLALASVVNLKTTYQLCKIIQQWPVICITDPNASYMQLSHLCFMNLLFVSSGIGTEFIFSCVSELKLGVSIRT